MIETYRHLTKLGFLRGRPCPKTYIHTTSPYLFPDVPGAPANLECLDRGPTHASLRWFPGVQGATFGEGASSADDEGHRGTPPPHITPNSYTLIVTELDSLRGGPPNKRKLADIPPWNSQPDGSIHRKVTDLKPDHRYTAEVYAVNPQFGVSDSSNQVTFKTMEAGKLVCLVFIETLASCHIKRRFR